MLAQQIRFIIHVPEHDCSYYTRHLALRGTDTHLVCYQDLFCNSQARKTGSVNNKHTSLHKFFKTLRCLIFSQHAHVIPLYSLRLSHPPPFPCIPPSLLVLSLLPPAHRNSELAGFFGLGDCESAEQQCFDVGVWSGSAVTRQSNGPLAHCSINHASSLVWRGDLCALQHREKWVKKHSRIGMPREDGERLIWPLLNS